MEEKKEDHRMGGGRVGVKRAGGGIVVEINCVLGLKKRRGTIVDSRGIR